MNDYKITGVNIPPSGIYFTGKNNKLVMSIDSYKIWVDPDIEVTEAAQLVLDAMRHIWYKQVWNEAIEAAAKVCRTTGIKHPQQTGQEACELAIRALKEMK